MRIQQLKIKNFKSLENITFSPSDLSIIIGPNNSGKSNFSSGMKFLSEVYDFGLETAVRRNGGYENIALRRKRRSKSSISFLISLKIDPFSGHEFYNEIKQFFFYIQPEKEIGDDFYVKHSFAFRATKENVKAEFKIESERFIIYQGDGAEQEILFEVERRNNELIKFRIAEKKILDNQMIKLFSSDSFSKSSLISSSQELLISNTIFTYITPFNTLVKNWAIYQFNPSTVRLEGVPTPNPQLDIFGRNLPALVDWLMVNHREKWQRVIETIKIIIPELEDISTDYLHNKTLGIFFKEEGFGRKWTVDEISDGTILTLSMLCSVIDPRKAMVLLEEPENSVHPWIIHTIMDFFKEISKTKNIIITTHSTILIDLVHPQVIWTISRSSGVTKLQRLIDLDSEIVKGWENGDYKISEYIDSGLIPNIVP